MTIRKRPGSNLEWALFYASLGWHVFPLKTDKGKAIKEPHAMTTEGRAKDDGGHNAATRAPAIIRDWWTRSPASGIGVHCARSGLVLVDVDPRNGGDKTLTRLRMDHPTVFESPVEALTGGGGTHLFFLAEKDARYPGNLGPVSGIDIKHNGYVILAPSPHEFAGKFYAWLDGKSPEDGEALMPRLSAALMHEIRDAARNGKRRTTRQDDLIEADDDDPFAEIDDRALGLTEDQIRKIVFSVPNEGHRETDPVEYVKAGARSYDDWFVVICGIWHETNGSEDGKQIALEWAQQAAMHSESDFEKKWRSAEHENKGFRPKTFRSVIQMANEATKEEREQRYEHIRSMLIEATTLDEVRAAAEKARTLALPNPLQREDLAAQYRTAVKRITNSAVISPAQAKREIAYLDPTLTNLPPWCETICYVSGENLFVDWRDARRSWTKQAFDNTFARAAMSEEDVRAGASKPTHLPSDLALTRYGVKVVDARGYLPWAKTGAGVDPFYEMEGRTYVNTYTGRFAAKAPKVFTGDDRIAVNTFEQYGATIMPVAREWWLQKSWMRYVIGVRKRVGWSPVLYSIEGIGKTLLFDLLTSMVGINNVSLITGMTLHDRFNGWAENKLLALVEEVGGFDRKERFDTLNAIKPIITNSRITVRRMNKESYDVMNTVNVFLTTNKLDFFDLNRDGGDTRLWVPTPGFRAKEDLAEFKRSNRHFFPNVLDAFTHHAGAIKKHLLSAPYHPEFEPGNRAPPSEMKQEIIQATKSDVRLLIEDVIRESNRPDISSDLLRIDALIEACGEVDHTIHLPQDRWLAAELQGMGFTRLGRVRTGRKTDQPGVFWSRTPARFKGALATVVKEFLAERENDDI